MKEINKTKNSLKNDLYECWAIFNAAKDLLMVLDLDFKILKANLATSKFLNKSNNEIIGKTCYQLIHGISKPPKECPLNIVKKSKKHEEAECYLSEKDIWLQVSSDPIFDEKGKMAKIAHIVRDITAFRRTEASLRESEGRFRAVFDYANHGIQVVDTAERKTIMVNKTLCQMLGYSKEELKNLKAEDIYPQKDVPSITEQLKKLLREEIHIAKDIPLLRKDGSIFYADVSAAPFAMGGKTYLMGVFRDKTEHKSA